MRNLTHAKFLKKYFSVLWCLAPQWYFIKKYRQSISLNKLFNNVFSTKFEWIMVLDTYFSMKQFLDLRNVTTWHK
eukprot:TRINITY_DN16079_c0_g1_i1.p1 TRINITY_DN16079_c0_g1~~TRINITY_DN16079_c0_g1_i1.p1  ORF type:complete len:75 (-),score=9.56 TRINITY_DN16079_c0_g1_i1:33-257(-)